MLCIRLQFTCMRNFVCASEQTVASKSLVCMRVVNGTLFRNQPNNVVIARTNGSGACWLLKCYYKIRVKYNFVVHIHQVNGIRMCMCIITSKWANTCVCILEELIFILAQWNWYCMHFAIMLRVRYGKNIPSQMEP